MQSDLANATHIVAEYQALLADLAPAGRAPWPKASLKRVRQALVNDADWTPRAAHHLTILASEYGSFFLRNALALAIAMDIEDGDRGF